MADFTRQLQRIKAAGDTLQNRANRSSQQQSERHSSVQAKGFKFAGYSNGAALPLWRYSGSVVTSTIVK